VANSEGTVFFDKDREEVTVEDEETDSSPSSPETPRNHTSVTRDSESEHI
jgi:hypothetical protein